MSVAVSDTVSVAVIGAGFIADYHINGLKAAGGAKIAALVDSRSEHGHEKARSFDIPRVETDYRKVLDDPGIDAVVIATPDATHERLAVDALEAGKSVLLQKPMALDTAQCRHVMAAEKGSRGRLTVSFMHRYFAEVAWLRALLAEGKLGKVHTIRIRNATPGADWSEWFYRPENVSGGVVMQLGVHGIDLCQYLFGVIADVSAQAMTARPERTLADGRTVHTALDDNVSALYRFRDGIRGCHEMSYTEIQGCDRFRMEVYAEEGTVWLRTERGAAALYAPAATGMKEWIVPPLPQEPFGKAHHSHWLSVVRGDAPPDGTSLAGLLSVAVAETIYAAADSGCRTRVDVEECP